MTYTYKDMPDKTKEGIKKETSLGLAVAAFYFETTLGIPQETFKSFLEEKCKSDAEKLLWYMNFRNDNPELYTEKHSKISI